jgi:hypothetical protein
MKRLFYFTIITLLTFTACESKEPSNSSSSNNSVSGKSDANGHDYVDLGLSVKWAICNVGANSPEEYGDYFAWGEIAPKTIYTIENYKWWDGAYNKITKYCTFSDYGIVDNKTVLELSDDAANVNWGGDWRMPTIKEQKELINKCTWIWNTKNGKNGYTIIGPSGKSIFLPAAGIYNFDENLSQVNIYGGYMSSVLSQDIIGSQSYYGIGFESDTIVWGSGSRCSGLTVRAVLP